MVRRKSKAKSLRINKDSNDNKSLEKSKKTNLNMSRKKKMINVYSKDNNKTMQMSRAVYKQIKLLQLSTEPLLPKLPFSRVVREIFSDLGVRDMRIQSNALKALQEACELYMTQYFEDSYSCTLHAKRVTLQIKDMHLVRKIRGREDVINH